MRIAFIAVGLVLGVAACSPTTYYSKPGATLAQIQADSALCLRQLPNLSAATPPDEFDMRFAAVSDNGQTGRNDLRFRRTKASLESLLHHHCMLEAGYAYDA